jgi:rhodanese-related sulfurtransferase
MANSLKQMMADANQAVPRISPEQAREMQRSGKAVIVDVRDADEVRQSGKAKGALHIPRGLLEFRADRESPAHDNALGQAKAVILYCASGGRSALAGNTLRDLGYREVYNLGGFSEWAGAGYEVEK